MIELKLSYVFIVHSFCLFNLSGNYFFISNFIPISLFINKICKFSHRCHDCVKIIDSLRFNLCSLVFFCSFRFISNAACWGKFHSHSRICVVWYCEWCCWLVLPFFIVAIPWMKTDAFWVQPFYKALFIKIEISLFLNLLMGVMFVCLSICTYIMTKWLGQLAWNAVEVFGRSLE